MTYFKTPFGMHLEKQNKHLDLPTALSIYVLLTVRLAELPLSLSFRKLLDRGSV